MNRKLAEYNVSNIILIRRPIIKAYSVFIALLPIFGQYFSGIPGLNVGELILVAFTILCVMDNIKHRSHPINKKTTSIFVFLIFYLTFSSLLSVLTQGNSAQIVEIFIRTTRFTFYIVCVIFTSQYYFDIDIASKWMIRICILATIYIIAQYIAYYQFNIILKAHISFIPIYSGNIYADMYSVNGFYRPSSFFLEPSHLVQYTVIGLIVVLFKQENLSKYDYLKAISISIAIILSTSLQGIPMLFIVWIAWGVRLISKNLTLRKLLIFMVFIVLFIIVLILLLKTTVVQNTLSRISYGSDFQNSDAFIARFQGMTYLNNVPNYLKLIGLGYGSIPSMYIFMSSIAYMLYGGGYLALIVTLLLFLRLFLSTKNTVSKVIIITSVVLLTATEWLYIYISVYYFSFICYGDNLNKLIDKKLYVKYD